MDNEVPLSLMVQEVRREADGVVSVSFVHPDGEELPAWEAGAHLEIVLPSGTIRQYSMWGNPSDRHTYRVGVLREDQGRGGSREIHDTGLVGRTLTVHGPRNRFPVAAAPKYIFVAGGIGVTPLIPMAQEITGRADVPAWEFHYVGRSEKTMAFAKVLEEIAGQADNGELKLIRRDQEEALDLRAVLATADKETAIYCCGPNRLMASIEEVCEELGLPGLHLERFGAAPVSEAEAAEEAAANASFEVELAQTGTTVTVGPDQTILECVRDLVPGTPASCEEGFCGTCEVRILAGAADHRDIILTKSEREANQSMFICVSRSAGPKLTIDL